ncbi:phosphoenolpyruvate carboxylase [Tanacetum coccineum]
MMGIYPLVNVQNALDSFLKGAALGSTLAMVDAGLVYWEIRKKDEGVRMYKRDAKLGDPSGLHIFLIQRNQGLRDCLAQFYAKDVIPDDKQEVDDALHREIQATFCTDEIRRTPKTSQVEMRVGMSYFHLYARISRRVEERRCSRRFEKGPAACPLLPENHEAIVGRWNNAILILKNSPGQDAYRLSELRQKEMKWAYRVPVERVEV